MPYRVNRVEVRAAAKCTASCKLWKEGKSSSRLATACMEFVIKIGLGSWPWPRDSPHFPDDLHFVEHPWTHECEDHGERGEQADTGMPEQAVLGKKQP